ncbi:MAG: S41 family peptidase, partial [Planctomycetaceae bacterium]
MTRPFPFVTFLIVLVAGGIGRAEDTESAGESSAPQRMLAVIDTVLEHHIDPPTRQQMVLDLVRQMHTQTGEPVPTGLSRRVSRLTETEDLHALLSEFWTEARTRSKLPPDRLELFVLSNMLEGLPGEANLTSAKDHAVEEQLAANRYVGVGIALRIDKQSRQPAMAEVIPNGPADRIGAREGDHIEQIDGVSTEGKPLAEVVDLLRGERGTEVTLVLRQPGETESRTLTITRDVVPIDSVTGYELLPAGDGQQVAYLKIERITASTAHELRQYEQKLIGDGAAALVLDLRFNFGGELHHAVLLADALLDGGKIGRVRTAAGEIKEYEAQRESLFKDLPLAVLMGRNMSGPAEWIAAALKDQNRAVLIGEPTAGRGFVHTGVAVPGTEWV